MSMSATDGKYSKLLERVLPFHPQTATRIKRGKHSISCRQLKPFHAEPLPQSQHCTSFLVAINLVKVEI